MVGTIILLLGKVKRCGCGQIVDVRWAPTNKSKRAKEIGINKELIENDLESSIRVSIQYSVVVA